MHHELFALFDDKHQAEVAVGELAGRSELTNRFRIASHADRVEGESTNPVLEHHERGTRCGIRLGFLIGAVQGAILMLLGELHRGFLGAGPLAAVFLGAVGGGLIGAFIGFLAGIAYGDPHFARLAARLREGKVLVSVDVKGLPQEHEIERILRRHGATVSHRSFL